MRKHLPALVIGPIIGCLFDILVVAFFHGIDSPLPWSAWSAIPLFAFGTLWGPIALPFATSFVFPKGSFPRSLEAWDEHGLRAWVSRGLVFGALLSWPLLVIPAASVELGQPHLVYGLITVPIAGALSMIGLFDRVRTAPISSSPRGGTTTVMAFYALMLPSCLGLITPNPIWRFDAYYVEDDAQSAEVQPGVTVELADGPLWVIGFHLHASGASTFVRAPLTILTGLRREQGRVVLPSGVTSGAFYVPIAPDGTRLDDSLVDRILARSRFERFSVFALLPFVRLLALAVLLLMRAPWRSVHASLARVEGVLDVRAQTLVATNSVSLHFEDGDVWTLKEGDSLPMRFGGTSARVLADARLEFLFEGAPQEGAFRASHRREALLDVRHAAEGQAPRTRMPTEGGWMLVALYGAMLFAVWWVWSAV